MLGERYAVEGGMCCLVHAFVSVDSGEIECFEVIEGTVLKKRPHSDKLKTS